ncbi:SDR family oxidoreductase [Marinilongibacter aquaticus]|uniref:SDR family NAD(P)-dependent oxidoreductase n=1 Tax=Marinilongibacter aquaticus TaxID=2975157 RepID=UPI0021BD3FF7|nr:SDR family oxidoreductase [Marinilongibacter aquaticus]UBM59966.1 SDR family oxidoreductase [Marinilongibacter aquaticus]
MQVKESFNLKGKTALVTGGSEGIGKAIALAFAELGAVVLINYYLGSEKADEIRKQIEQRGGKCFLLEHDISKLDTPSVFKGFLEANHLDIDILVLNASVQFRKAWDDISPEEFESQINTNFRASLLLIQALYPNMKKKAWGRILTIGSIQQIRPHSQMTVYAATKAAQVNLVKNLAPQFAPFGITINNLAPGAIATKRNKEALENPDYKRKVEAKIPMGLVGEAFDCAPMALLLCSDAGRYITGQDIYVDGGMSLLT